MAFSITKFAVVLSLAMVCSHCTDNSGGLGNAGGSGGQAGGGSSGVAGASAQGGTGGESGTAGTSGNSGNSGASGTAGASGTGGSGGSGGGSSGTAGTSAAGGAGASGTAGTAGQSTDLTEVKMWVKEVILGPEFGSSAKLVARWKTSPQVSVFGANSEQKQLVNEVVATLNTQLLPSGITMNVGADQDTSASFKIYFAPLSEFDQIAQDNGFTNVPGNWGLFWTFWNGNREIYKSVVMLANDLLTGTSMRHFAHEEITQALGMSNDSAIYSDSVFFAKGSDGGQAQTLSPLDKKLVQFVYQNVQPNDDEVQVDKAFDLYWVQP
jgi:hypothetical protein